MTTEEMIKQLKRMNVKKELWSASALSYKVFAWYICVLFDIYVCVIRLNIADALGKTLKHYRDLWILVGGVQINYIIKKQ